MNYYERRNRFKLSDSSDSLPRNDRIVFNDPSRPLSELIDDFLEYCIARGHKKSTIGAYKTNLRQFYEHAGEKSLDQVDPAFIRGYLKPITTVPKRISAITTLRSFGKFLKIEVNYNPFEHLRVPKRQEFLPEVLTEKEINEVLNTVEKPEERVIFETMYSTGLRTGEFINLRLGDVDFKEGVIRIPAEKGPGADIVPIGKCALDLIKEYGLPHLTRHEVYRVFNKYSSLTGKRLKPRLLRNSCAYHMLERGAELRFVKEMLRHGSMETTQIYAQVSVKRFKLSSRPGKRLPAFQIKEKAAAPEGIESLFNFTKSSRNYLKEHEAKGIFKTLFKNYDKPYYHHRYLYQFMYYAPWRGIREISLRQSDYDAKAGILSYYDPIKNKIKSVKLRGILYETIEKQLEYLKKYNIDSDYLFPSAFGKANMFEPPGEYLKAAAQDAKMRNKLTPRMLRKAFILNEYFKGRSIGEITQALGYGNAKELIPFEKPHSSNNDRVTTKDNGLRVTSGTLIEESKNTNNPILGSQQVAKILGISTQSVINYAKQGQLQHDYVPKVGYFFRKNYVDFINKWQPEWLVRVRNHSRRDVKEMIRKTIEILNRSGKGLAPKEMDLRIKHNKRIYMIPRKLAEELGVGVNYVYKILLPALRKYIEAKEWARERLLEAAKNDIFQDLNQIEKQNIVDMLV